MADDSQVPHSADMRALSDAGRDEELDALIYGVARRRRTESDRDSSELTSNQRALIRELVLQLSNTRVNLAR